MLFLIWLLPHSGYGIAMYNSAGAMVYHGEMMPLDAKLYHYF